MLPNLSRFDRWIFHSYAVTPEGLGLYRIAFALFVLFFLTPGSAESLRFSFVGTLPDVFFLPPPGPMQLAPGFPPEIVFIILEGLLILSLTAILFGYYTRTASVATSLLLLIGFGFSYSLGKVNHTILLALLPAVMSFSNWGAAYSFDAQAKRTSRTVASWPLVLLLLLTGFAMFTAGFAKVLGGWLDPSTQATLGRFVRQFFVHGRQDFFASMAIDLQNPLLWEAFDVLTILFEVGFLLAVFHPMTTRLFVVGAIAFHTGITLVLNIAFIPNYVVYAAVFPWSSLAQLLPSGAWLERRLSSFPRWAYLGAVLGAAVGVLLMGSPLQWVNETMSFTSDLVLSDVLALGLAWLAIGGAFVIQTRAFLPQKPTASIVPSPRKAESPTRPSRESPTRKRSNTPHGS